MTTRKKNKLRDEAYFQILRYLSENPYLSQRELGELAGVSLGAVNYCVRALIDRGFVKAENFRRSPLKYRYAYVLTPKGLLEKTRLARQFLKHKLAEYRTLENEIKLLNQELRNQRGF